MHTENIPWGLELSGIGILIVFAMLLVLMISLMIMGALDRPEKAEAAPAVEAAPAAAPLAAAAAPAALASSNDLSEEKIATLAIAIHTALRGGKGAPKIAANKSGSGLNNSRWVAVGRSMQTQSWHRK